MEATIKKIVLNPISNIIPADYLKNNKTVETLILLEGFTEIENSAFLGCLNLQRAFLPESLEIIGKGAFAGCESLAEIVIPNNVKTIGNCAFMDCKSLPEIKIPNNVKTVGDYAFSSCENLKEILIDNTEEYVKQNWSKAWHYTCGAKTTYLR